MNETPAEFMARMADKNPFYIPMPEDEITKRIELAKEESVKQKHVLLSNRPEIQGLNVKLEEVNGF